MSNINIAQSVDPNAGISHPEGNNSSIVEQQYNWLMKNNKDNGVINEQEFESKSRDDTYTQKSKTQSEILDNTVKNSEMVWNDPDLIPDL